MSIDNKALSCLPSSVTAQNAESGANSALASWKGMSASWNQETADEVGKFCAFYAIKWNDAAVSELNKQIDKLEAEQSEKEGQLGDLNAKIRQAEQEFNQAVEDAENCLQQPDGTMFGSVQQDARHIPADERKKEAGWKIIDRIGWNDAQSRKNRAKSAKQSAENQKNNLSKQISDLKSKISKLEDEKEKETRKIEGFIMNVFELRLMNESKVFLHTLKDSKIEISKANRKKLFGRLFFIENAYRKVFEQLEPLIKNAGETYSSSDFEITPESIEYTAERSIKANKFKGKFDISLVSKDSNSATLSYTGKNDFIIPKSKLEGAQEKIQPVFKNYELKVDRSNFTAILNKKYENDAIAAELEQLNANSDEYAKECEAILNTMQANGASNSKIRILMGKISNWHLAHWPKVWYKIVFILACIVILAGIVVGAIGIGFTIFENKQYAKSFVEWSIYQSDETKEFGSAVKRFALSDSEMRYIRISTSGVRTAEELQQKVQSYSNRAKKYPDEYIPLTQEESDWLKQNLAGSLPSASTTTMTVTIRDYSGNIEKRNGKQESKGRLEGVLSVTTAEDGSIKEITDLSGVGFRKYKY